MWSFRKNNIDRRRLQEDVSITILRDFFNGKQAFNDIS